MRAYEEIVDFIAAGSTPEEVVAFSPSAQAKERVAELIAQQKTVGLSPEEASELKHFLELEHIIRLAKARAWALQQR
jgi:hypothetical protein